MKKIFTFIIALGAFIGAKAADVPTYPGGESAMNTYINENTRYPAIAQENGVEGIVVVGFMVMPDGSLQHLKVVKSVDPDLEKEAMRVVSGMPAWIPAEKDGTPIEAPSKVSIPFLLP